MKDFWASDPRTIFSSLSLFPCEEMSKGEKLNALTRLTLLVSLGLYVAEIDCWYLFLAAALFFILIVGVTMKEDMGTEIETPDLDTAVPDVSESFTVTPTYTGTDFTRTMVPPTFSDEWHIPPPTYDLIEDDKAGESAVSFIGPPSPQDYPHRQYLTRTNLMPNDEWYVNSQAGSKRNTREYVNSTYLRHDLAHRENLMDIYKRKLHRRHKTSSCNDGFSPYYSF